MLIIFLYLTRLVALITLVLNNTFSTFYNPTISSHTLYNLQIRKNHVRTPRLC